MNHRTDLLHIIPLPGHGGLRRAVGAVVAGAEGVVEVDGGASVAGVQDGEASVGLTSERSILDPS